MYEWRHGEDQVVAAAAKNHDDGWTAKIAQYASTAKPAPKPSTPKPVASTPVAVARR